MHPDHPEDPSRLGAIEDRLHAAGLFHFLQHYDAPEVSRAQLERVHEIRYLDDLDRLSPREGLVHLDLDTVMNPHTLDAARHAAGAVVLATDLVIRGEMDNAFCSVRPPGHHAERSKAMGFCFYNNIAVGAAHALAQYGLERVAILDFDVHHGNGSEDIFRNDDRVMVCSTFQHPFYPDVPFAHNHPRLVNVPLKEGDGGEDFQLAITQKWEPSLDAFAPQMIFVSAGFDAHRDDDMAGLNLTEMDYGWVTERILAMAERHTGAKVVLALEGGYEPHALGRSVEACLRVLMGLS